MSRDPQIAHGGIAPFGYKWTGGRLVPDATEAPVRSLIFELFLKHRRKKTVAKVLNDLGHRTRNGSLFSDTTIGRLLSDPIVVGGRGTDAGHSPIEPILDRDAWERTQSLLGSRPAKQTPRLFTSLIFCDCGAKMSISSGSAKYACRACRRRISETDLEEILHAKLGDRSIFEASELFDNWAQLSTRDRRSIIEHICDRITVGKDSITLEFSLTPELPDHSNDLEVECSSGSGNDRFNEGPLLSEAEAAKFLGVSKMTLLRKRHSAEISFFRVGSRILYSKQKHLLPFLSHNENKDR